MTLAQWFTPSTSNLRGATRNMVPRATRPTIAPRDRGWSMHSYLRLGFAFVCCGGLLAVQLRATSRNGASAGRREPLAAGCHDRESCVLTRQRVKAEAAAIARRRAMLEQVPPPEQSEAERQRQLGRLQPAETKASVVLEAEASEQATGDAAAPPKELHLDVAADVQPAAQQQEAEETDAAWCRRAAATFGVVPHQTWGSLSTAQQATWTSRGCDATIAAAGAAAKSPLSMRTPPLTPRRRTSSSASAAASSSAAAAATASSGDAAAQCTEMRERHGVLPGTSWGTLSSRQQRLWDQLDCNTIDPELMRQRRAEEDELANYAARQKEALAGRTPERKLRRAAPFVVSAAAASAAATAAAPDAAPDAAPAAGAGGVGARPPVVAVCVCTTSRNTDFTTLAQFALFSIMLPSLRSSIEPTGGGGGGFSAASVTSSLGSLFGGGGGGSGGGSAAAAPFEYWVYMTFDEGDKFFDDPAREAEVRGWLDANMVAPLAQQGVTLQIALLRYRNSMRKPGPAFNFMTAAAYEDGADYIYRVNDDTKFVGPWASSAVATLAAFSPPNVGVVGPLCAEGNTLIMTHDLVHRTHLAIFEHYYPPVFSDWWMVIPRRRSTTTAPPPPPPLACPRMRSQSMPVHECKRTHELFPALAGRLDHARLRPAAHQAGAVPRAAHDRPPGHALLGRPGAREPSQRRSARRIAADRRVARLLLRGRRRGRRLLLLGRPAGGAVCGAVARRDGEADADAEQDDECDADGGAPADGQEGGAAVGQYSCSRCLSALRGIENELSWV